jgi:hypothetical protein
MRKFVKIRLHLEMKSIFIHRKNNKRYKALTAWCETLRFCGTRGFFGIIPWILGASNPQVCSPLIQIDPNRRVVICNYIVLNFEKISSLKLIVIYQIQIYKFVPLYSYTTHKLKPTVENLLQERSLLLCQYMSWRSYEGQSRANKCNRQYIYKIYTSKNSSISLTQFPHYVFSLKLFSINSHINILLSSVAISYSWQYEIPRVVFCNLGV